MFGKQVIYMVAGILILSLSASVSMQAQSRASKKEKKTALLFHKNSHKINIQGVQFAKSATDNDIGRELEQFYDGDTWNDEYRGTYSYSSDRRTITINQEYFDGETNSWMAAGMFSLVLNAEGYPLSAFSEFFNTSFSETFYYNDSGRLDSVFFEDIYEGEQYSELTELIYVTADSIRLFSTITENGETEIVESDYFLNKGGNFIEVYDEGSFMDRYTSYGITFNDLLKNLYNEFFFVEMYNDELYPTETEWVPYSRTSLTTDNGVVLQVQEEFYNDEGGNWVAEYRNSFIYNEGKIVQANEGYSFDGVNWTEDYRTLYTYGAVTSSEQEESIPVAINMYQNYPNPFNPSTKIAYELPVSGKVLLEVYNVLGNRVATLVNSNQQAGSYQVTFNADGMPSGIYYYKLAVGLQVQVRSMTLIK